MTIPGQFSPIEDVIREAEERAEAAWRREHEPCPHEDTVDITTVDSVLAITMCVHCGARWEG